MYLPGLPDAASIEASKMVEPENDRTVLIDASTAFRVNDEWTYGFPGEYPACVFVVVVWTISCGFLSGICCESCCT